jgi:hypothetical protein
MANDTASTANAAALQQAAQLQTQISNANKDAINSTVKLTQKATLATNATNKWGQSVAKTARNLKTLTANEDAANTSLEKMDKLYGSVTDQIVTFALKGKQANLGMAVETKKLIETQQGLAKSVIDTSRQLEGQIGKYKEIAAQYVDNHKKLDALNKKKEKGLQLSEEEDKAFKVALTDKKKLGEALKDQKEQVEISAGTLHKQNLEMVKGHNATLSGIKDMRAANREAMHLQGGFKSLGASIQEAFDNKLFKWADSKAWMVTAALAVEAFNKAFSLTAKMYNDNMSLARQYNIQSKDGMLTLAEAAKIAEEQSFSAVKTAARLGIELEKVQEIGDQIAHQKLGVISNQTIQETTKNVNMLRDVVAEFAQSAGIDSATAVDMLRQRTEDMGKSASQAAADLRQMTTVLTQMQGSVEGDAIGMQDMVKLIDQASQNSGGFIVDTRLMTQAMRAAANEAERLGASKKMAMKSAEAMGKVVGGEGGEAGGGKGLMSLLAGMDLAKDIAKADKNKMAEITKGLTAGQKEFVNTIKKKLDSGEIDQFQASSLIEENMQATDAMVQKKFEHMTSILGKGPEKYRLIAHEYGITNTAAMHMYDTQKKGLDDQKQANDWLAKNREIEISKTQADLAATGKTAEEKKKLTEKLKKLQEEDPSIHIGDFLEGNLTMLEEIVDKNKDYNKQVEALQKKMGISAEQAGQVLSINADKSKGEGQKKAEEQKLFSKWFDPAEKAKDTALQIKGMKNDDKISGILSKSYNVGEKNVLAQNKVKELAEKASKGEDITEGLEELGKLSSKQITNQEALANEQISVAKQILNAIINKGGVVGNTAAHFAGDGPLKEIAKFAAYSAATLGLLKVGKKLPSTMLQLGKKMVGKGGDKTSSLAQGEHIAEELGGLGKFKLGDATKDTERVVTELSKKSSFMKKMWTKTAEIAAKTKGKKGIAGAAILGLGLATAAFSGESKAAEAEEGQPKEKEKEHPTSATTDTLKTASTAGVFGHVGLQAAGKFGVKGAAKLGAKTIGKSIPLLGTIVGAISTASQISDMYDKYKSGKSLGKGDYLRLTTEVASMIPLIGTAAALGGAAMDITGGYDKLNEIDDKKTSTASQLAEKESPTSTDTDVPKNIADMAASLNTLVKHAEEDRNNRILGKSLPAGGSFNTSANAMAVAPLGGETSKGIDETKGTRPTLDSRRGNQQASAQVDTSTYNEAEDSIMVKWLGMGELLGMFKRKEATSRGS